MLQKKSLISWRKIKSKVGVFVPYLILAILVGLAVNFIPKLIIIRSISCHSQYGPCSASLVKMLEKAQNNNYSSAKRIISDILENDIGIGEYNIQLQFPSSFKVNVLERKSVFAFKEKDGAAFFLVGSDGRVLKTQESTNLPVLQISGKNLYDVGEEVGDDVLFGLRILNDLHQYFDIEKVDFGQDLRLKIRNGPEVILPKQGDRKILIGALRLIMMKMDSDEKFSLEKARDKVIIDLRFKNPVIK